MEFITCSECGAMMPAISKFCTSCGAKAPQSAAPAAPAAPAAEPAAPAAAPAAAPEKQKKAKAKAEKSGKKVRLLPVLAVLLMLGLGAGCVLQYVRSNQAADRYAAIIRELQADVDSKNEELNNIMETVSSLQADADAMYNVFSLVENRLRFATGAEHAFHASSPIVVMSLSRGDIGRVTLTTDYDDFCTTWYEQDNNACTLEYASDSWEGSTVDLLFYPQYEGTTLFTFTNDLGSDSFDVLAVVLP